MFNPNSATNDKPHLSQQPSDGKKSITTIAFEVETDFKNDNNDLNHFISDCQKRVYNWSEFPELAQNIYSQDQFTQYSGLIGIRKLLDPNTIDQDGIQMVIDAGLLPIIIEFLKKDDELQFQLEATWILSTLSAGNVHQIREIVNQGAFPILAELLKSCHPQLVKHAIVVVGNLARKLQYRDLLLDHGVLHPLIALLEKALERKDNTLINNGARALSNLCGGYPRPTYQRVADATLVLCSILKEVTDLEVCWKAVFALECLLNERQEKMRALDSDVVSCLINCLSASKKEVVSEILRILGDIITKPNEQQADAVLKGPSTRDFVKKLFQLLKQKFNQEDMRRKVCSTLSNITCKKSFDLDLVIGNREYIKQLTNMALYDFSNVQKEAVLTLSNMTGYAKKNQLISMARNGVLDCMYKLIQQYMPDEVILNELKTIQNFLTLGALISRKEATNNKYLIKLKQKSVLEKIKKMKEGQNLQVSELTLQILKKFFKESLLKKNLKLKRAIICFGNERHVLFGLFQNKKKRLSV